MCVTASGNQETNFKNPIRSQDYSIDACRNQFTKVSDCPGDPFQHTSHVTSLDCVVRRDSVPFVTCLSLSSPDSSSWSVTKSRIRHPAVLLAAAGGSLDAAITLCKAQRPACVVLFPSSSAPY